MDETEEMRLNIKRQLGRALGNLARIVSYVPILAVAGLSQSAYFLRWLSSWLTFVPREDDIYVVTYPRSGTTWLQMILYQLTTGGRMDFTHISEVVPFFEKTMAAGNDFSSLSSPRLFKTHLRRIPKWPGKYIYVVRNGKDVAISYFHFYKTHLGYRGTFDQFFDRFLRGKLHYGSWFKHVSAWRARAADPNVLILNYEDLLRDLDGCLKKIAEFCDLKVAPERHATIVENCSFAFMKKHEDKFDPITEFLCEQGLIRHSFLRAGGIQASRTLLTEGQNRSFERIALRYQNL